jgi:hypothetical protein
MIFGSLEFPISTPGSAAALAVLDQIDRRGQATLSNVGSSAARVGTSTGVATRAFGHLAMAMQDGRGSVIQLASAAGHLVNELGSVAQSAKFAAGAAALGAIIPVVAIGVTALMSMEKQVKATDLALSRIGKVSFTQIGGQIEQQRRIIEKAEADYVAKREKEGLTIGPWSAAGKAMTFLEQQEAQLNELIKRGGQLRKEQRIHVQEMVHTQQLALRAQEGALAMEQLRTTQLYMSSQLYQRGDGLRAPGVTAADVRRRQIAEDEARATDEILEKYRRVEATTGAIIPLTEQQVRLQNKELADARAIAQAKRDQLEVETAIAEEDTKRQTSANRALGPADQYAVKLGAARQEALKKMVAGQSAGVVDGWLSSMQDSLRAETWKPIIANFTTALGDSVRSGFQSAFNGEGVSGAIGAFAGSMLQALGSMAIQIGTAALSFLILQQIIKGGIEAWAPELGIAGALGLIALGGALEALGGSMGGSSGSGSGGGGSSYSAASYGNRSSSGVLYPNAAPPNTQGLKAQPVQQFNFTVIGERDPQAQRAIKRLIQNADARGNV